MAVARFVPGQSTNDLKEKAHSPGQWLVHARDSRPTILDWDQSPSCFGSLMLDLLDQSSGTLQNDDLQ